MSVTINAFPPRHAFTSARSWFLAIIVLLHVGFFWVLNSGLSQSFVTVITEPFKVIFPDDNKKAEPPPKPIPVDFKPVEQPVAIPPPTPVSFADPDDQTRITGVEMPEPTVLPSKPTPEPRPMVTLPQIDQRHGLSEPLYPPQEIRLSHTGTVLLSVYVLENGRVGEVRLDQSSGYERLDESALREARKWRFEPGMRDGSPVAMWKQVPIRFRLKE